MAHDADHWGGCLRHHLGAGLHLVHQHRRDHPGAGRRDRQNRRDDRDHPGADHPWADDRDRQDHPGVGRRDQQNHRDDRDHPDERPDHRGEHQDHRGDQQNHLYARRDRRGHWGARHWVGYCQAVAEWDDLKPTADAPRGAAEWDDRLPTSARGDVVAASNWGHLAHQMYLAGAAPAAGPRPDAQRG